ncbi:MAG: hypothetical protein JWP47_1698 [Polaromonas sp.]|nr:hypothetical protein [Polaromonas sp.]
MTAVVARGDGFTMDLGELRLSRAHLNALPDAVLRPGFDPACLRPGILHLGCGSFHRAHQALLTQQAIEAAPGDDAMRWGIVSVSLVTPGIVNALAAQDGLYSVLERGPSATQVRVTGTLCRLIYAPQEARVLMQALADPAISLITLTITTAGYLTDPVSGRLDVNHPDVRLDLRRQHPHTAIAWLVLGLGSRYQAGHPPPVVLSCDNLPSNGKILRQMCIDFAALKDDRLAAWIESQVQFPSTMVDRIVPVTMAQDRDDAFHALGLHDAAPVPAEPFSQWVIEHFDGPRPRWDAAGAQYVQDVSPWEASKLRLLNGGHLAVASLGLLAGCETVAETMALPGMSAYALRFMVDEQKPTLPPSDHDISAYARQLVARWRNPGIAHQLERVARDGSQKLPTRLLASLRDNREAGRPSPCTTLAIAAWMRCAAGLNDAGQPIDLQDPLRQELFRLADSARGNPFRLVDLLLEQTDIFGVDLASDSGFRQQLQHAMRLLHEQGARAAVVACVSAWSENDHGTGAVTRCQQAAMSRTP